MTLAQGLSLPFAQAGAMSIVPRLRATPQAYWCFCAKFMGAGVAQIYGLMADGTPIPLVQITAVMAALGLAAALLARPKVLRFEALKRFL